MNLYAESINLKKFLQIKSIIKNLKTNLKYFIDFFQNSMMFSLKTLKYFRVMD